MANSGKSNGGGGGCAVGSCTRVATVLHLAAALHFWYGIYYDCSYVHFVSPQAAPFGGKFKYLTFLDMIIQAVYFTICFANDLTGTNAVAPTARLPALRRLKDFWLAAFAFPLAFHVGLTFWSLWHIDRELVLPKALDFILPSWLNHVMHTNIMFFIAAELLLSYRAYPSRRSGLTALVAFMAAYLVWLHVVYHNSGVWVYPVLQVLALPQRIVFFALCLGLGMLLYVAGERLNAWRWKKELRSVAGGKGGKAK